MAVANQKWLEDAYNKGVVIRFHPLSGMKILMLVNEPGVFRNVYGDEVKAELAAEAGFDTSKLLKEKAKRERIAQAAQVIEREFEGVLSQEVVAESEGYKIVHLGNGRHNVIDPDDNKLNTKRPLSLQEAEKLLGSFVKSAESDEK